MANPDWKPSPNFRLHDAETIARENGVEEPVGPIHIAREIAEAFANPIPEADDAFCQSSIEKAVTGAPRNCIMPSEHPGVLHVSADGWVWTSTDPLLRIPAVPLSTVYVAYIENLRRRG